MVTIDTYITEKLRINKDTTLGNVDLSYQLRDMLDICGIKNDGFVAEGQSADIARVIQAWIDENNVGNMWTSWIGYKTTLKQCGISLDIAFYDKAKASDFDGWYDDIMKKGHCVYESSKYLIYTLKEKLMVVKIIRKMRDSMNAIILEKLK